MAATRRGSGWALSALAGNSLQAGTILIRQRGTKHKPGVNVRKGKDDTLFACITGFVKFQDKGRSGRLISVFPDESALAPDATPVAPAAN